MYIYRKNLALINLQGLICNKKPTNQPTRTLVGGVPSPATAEGQSMDSIASIRQGGS